MIDRHAILHGSRVTSKKRVCKERQKSVLVALYYSDMQHSHTYTRKGKVCIRISLHNMLMVPFRLVASSSIKVKLKLIRYISEIVYPMQCKQVRISIQASSSLVPFNLRILLTDFQIYFYLKIGIIFCIDEQFTQVKIKFQF